VETDIACPAGSSQTNDWICMSCVHIDVSSQTNNWICMSCVHIDASSQTNDWICMSCVHIEVLRCWSSDWMERCAMYCTWRGLSRDCHV